MNNKIVSSPAIVVTGASGGIGRLLVQKLAAKQLAVCSTEHLLEELKSHPSGGQIVPLQLDVTDEKSITQFVEEVSGYGILSATLICQWTSWLCLITDL